MAFVNKDDIRTVVKYNIDDEDIEYITNTVNDIMSQYSKVEKIPYGKDKYRHVVDEIVASLL